MSKRAEWIKAHYQLEEATFFGEPGWRAVHHDNRTFISVFYADTREEACRLARLNWGHFNYQDEAEAFGEIFR